jgi:ATP-dependent exoDNAse (exonuclease V) beta subunit
MQPPLKLYKSSAGSGKTFTLVKEFLQICLPNPYKFNRVAAITFTNAAAAEMKDRIIDTLVKLGKGEALDMRKLLLEAGLSEGDISNAPRLLENILYNYSRFSIGTIDSFFHKILRAFSKELGLPMDFEIFLDSDEALAEAVDEFLHHSYTLPQYHRILVEYIREKIAAGHSWKIRSDLLQIGKELLKDNTFLTDGAQLEDIYTFIHELRSLINEFESVMDQLGRQAIHTMEANGFSLNDFAYKGSGAGNHFYKILRNRRDYEPGARFVNAVFDINAWLTKGNKNMALVAFLEEKLMPIAGELLAVYERDHRRYMTAKELMRNIYTFAIYEEINKNLEKYRAENDVVLVSDFTKILAKHLISEQVSFIYSKVGSRYEHFLIDEFQDTSRLQWLNLMPLVENAVSQGQACLVVGDSKQAIYRWRGGEVALIERAISEEHFPDYTCKLTLTSNFRSEATIVQFNNQFFNQIHRYFNISENDLLQRIFQDVQQQEARKNTGGYVRLYMLEKSRRAEFMSAAGDKMIEAIRHCQEDGYSLKDIAILIRSKSEAAEVAQRLLGENIKFITQDSLYLDHSPAVRLLFSLLYYLVDTRDEIARTEALFMYLSFFRPGNTEEPIPFTDIFLDFQKEDGLYSQAFPKEFTENIYKLSILPVYELTEELVRIFGLNRQADIYVERFQDVVFEYTSTKGHSIRGFLEWYKGDKYTIVLPEDQNAIKILTIHKSKGLEFPVVIIPFANWDFKPGNSQEIMWVRPQQEPFNRFEYLPVNSSIALAKTHFAAEQEAEQSMTLIDNLNVLYVATTRAVSRLYIVSEKQEVKEKYGNMAQVISTVTANMSLDINDEAVFSFGEATPNSMVHKNTSNYTVQMEEYPVFNWRGHLETSRAIAIETGSEVSAYIPVRNYADEILKTRPELRDAAELFGINDAPGVVFPGYGHYKPLKWIHAQEKAIIFTSPVTDEQLISLYSEYLSGQIGKPVEIAAI